MPAISLIIPVYNVARWLPLCLESVAAQTFTDYEVILVNDGSTDESGYLCDQWAEKDSRIRVLHQANKGLSGARNTGIGAARGEYIAFLDSDDEVDPAWLEQLYRACTTTGAEMAICAIEDVTEDGCSFAPQRLTQPMEAGVFEGKKLLPYFYAPQCIYYTVAWNKLYRADLWKQLEYPLGKIHEDDAVAHRLFWDCPAVACLAEPLYRYRMREGSICRGAKLKPNTFDSIDALTDRYQFFRSVKADRSLQDKALAACWRRYLSTLALTKDDLSPQMEEHKHQAACLMQPLALRALGCKELRLTEKLSALRRAGKR